MTFKIVIPFWVDMENASQSTRLRNVLFVEKEVRQLVAYLQEKGVDIHYTIYDFSPTPLVAGATHYPFPLGSFRKAEKWNLCLRDTGSDYFIGLDSDMFIHPSDYEGFYQLLPVRDRERILLFNTRCVRDTDVAEIDWEGHQTQNLLGLDLHYYQSLGHTGSFGGLWVCPTAILKASGGFNENIRFRGDEDGELFTRINLDRRWELTIQRVLEVVPIHLPHLYHFGNPDYQSPNSHVGDWKPTSLL